MYVTSRFLLNRIHSLYCIQETGWRITTHSMLYIERKCTALFVTKQVLKQIAEQKWCTEYCINHCTPKKGSRRKRHLYWRNPRNLNYPHLKIKIHSCIKKNNLFDTLLRHVSITLTDSYMQWPSKKLLSTRYNSNTIIRTKPIYVISKEKTTMNEQDIPKNRIVTLEQGIAKNIIPALSIILEDNGSPIPTILYYSGKKYDEDTNGVHLRLTIQNFLTIRFTKDLIQRAINNSDEVILSGDISIPRKILIKYKNDMGLTESIIKSVCTFIFRQESLYKKDTDFDSDARYFNTQSGVVDLNTGTLLPHSPKFLMKKIANASFDESIPRGVLPSQFESMARFMFYDKMESEDENNRCLWSFINILGYLLILGNPQKKIFFWIGESDTGKSTLVRILLQVCGNYFTTSHPSLLLNSTNPSTALRNDIVRISSFYTTFLSELKKKDSIAVPLTKSITGGDRIPFRDLFKGEQVKTLQFKLVIQSNALPNPTEEWDEAFFKRLVILFFPNPIPDSMKQADFDVIFCSEQRNMDMLLTCILHELITITRTKHLDIAERFIATKEEMTRQNVPVVSTFIETCIRPLYRDQRGQARGLPRHYASDIFKFSFKPYCIQNDIQPMPSETAFYTAFKHIIQCGKVIQSIPGDGRHYYTNLEVNYLAPKDPEMAIPANIPQDPIMPTPPYIQQDPLIPTGNFMSQSTQMSIPPLLTHLPDESSTINEQNTDSDEIYNQLFGDDDDDISDSDFDESFQDIKDFIE